MRNAIAEELPVKVCVHLLRHTGVMVQPHLPPCHPPRGPRHTCTVYAWWHTHSYSWWHAWPLMACFPIAHRLSRGPWLETCLLLLAEWHRIYRRSLQAHNTFALWPHCVRRVTRDSATSRETLCTVIMPEDIMTGRDTMIARYIMTAGTDSRKKGFFVRRPSCF